MKKTQNALEDAKSAIVSGRHNVIVLDEVNVAVSQGLVSSSDVLELVSLNQYNMKIVLTGRNASDEILDVADKVTLMEEVKHLINDGILDRRGIEYSFLIYFLFLFYYAQIIRLITSTLYFLTLWLKMPHIVLREGN